MARPLLSSRTVAVVLIAFAATAVYSIVTALPANSAQQPTADARIGELVAKATQPYPLPPGWNPAALQKQTAEEAALKSFGCVQCHCDVTDMHNKETVKLGCTDCHGGDSTKGARDGKDAAHVQPRFPEAWATAANPVRSYTLLNHESPDFIRFVNPGDLRVAHISCGGCHGPTGSEDIVLQVRKSMMTHGCMLWGAALYNNGSIPTKWAHYGESYSMNGTPQRLQTPGWKPEDYKKGIVPYLDPLPRYEMSHPGNILRIFERGGRFRPEVGIPERDDDPGRPRTRLSNRGLGTDNRTDPVWVGITKTRLLDPTLNFLGTNDHPGDYRSSGCSGCHVVYANDRSKVNSGPFAEYGNRGFSFSKDMTVRKDESGHPIDHKFSLSIPTSQCMVCHMHPGTTVINTYVGYMWWDNETDGDLMYPKHQKYPTAEEFTQAALANPEEGAARGNWIDPEFLANLTDLNKETKHTQFADFHGHGWAFRAVFKRDRKGNLISHTGKVLEDASNEQLRKAMKFPEEATQLYTDRSLDDKPAALKAELAKLKERYADSPVHMLDIHLEKGMHCVDCHFRQDSHGNTKLYGEVRAAIEIQCIDCHGTVAERPTLLTTGPAAPEGGTNLQNQYFTPFGTNHRRFEWDGDRLFQNSVVDPNLRWEIVQTKDVVTPGSPHYNEKAHFAKTIRRADDGSLEWGGKLSTQGDGKVLAGDALLAHQNSEMSCIVCHTAWNPSCFGCHLVQKANRKMPALHNEGDVTRNYTSYNFQTLRDDVFMLARDGIATGQRINPSRSSCAIHVGSYNNNRESIYVQQQTISADGMSGIAFSTNVPHTVRGAGETKMCTDCHLSKTEDNNAIMAQLLMHGTNYVNFIGQYCWVAAGEHGLEAVTVTERSEPQAVLGSTLHKYAYPDYYHKFEEHGRKLEIAHEHPGKDISENLFRPFRKPEILSLQHRGEYLYAACGKGGLRIFDIAFIDDKAFAERITTAPVSPLGQKFYVETKYATAVAAPTTIAPDPTRKLRPENMEQPVHMMYAFIYVTDAYEGLIMVGAGTLLDGNPLNNFVKKDLCFNPDGILDGARNITIAGTYAYICCNAGLVVVSIEDPTHPYVASVIGGEFLHHPNAVQVQFRYAYVCDEEGIKVLDVTDLASPKPVTKLALAEAHNIYLARTYAYVAAGSQGLVILDIENPAEPKIDQIYNADGCISDLHDVKLGITYNTEFAYLADGRNGMHIVQLTSPEMSTSYGFSPRPQPQLIATRTLHENAHALAISKGVDRDRAVDEAGNQIAVFGRVGARPFNLHEQRKLFMHKGEIWKVSNDPNDKAYRRVP